MAVVGRGRRRSNARSGADLRTQIDVSFEDAAKGTEKVITVPKDVRCEKCDGSGALRWNQQGNL